MNVKSKFSFNIHSLFNLVSLSDVGLAWILFFSIFYQKLAPIGFGLMLISLFTTKKKVSVNDALLFVKKGPALWFIAYYLTLLVAMLWTNNIGFGLSKLENKLTFLIFPFLIVFSVITITIRQVVLILFSAILLALIISNILGYQYVSGVGASIDWNLFEQISNAKTFSWNMHRSYFSCYCNILIIFFLNSLIIKEIKSRFRLISIFGILVCSVGVIQSLSKINIILLILIFLIYFVYFVVKRLNYLEIILFSSLFALGVFFISNNKAITYRFNEIKQSTNDIKLQNNNGLESSKVRLIMWNTSWYLWRNNIIIGTGTGDYNDELKIQNIKNGNIGVARVELNSHNQFLNTGVQLGLLGFVILAMIFCSSFLIYPKSLWHISVLMVFLVNFLVESFLETQSGIVLFCVLLILFYSPQRE